MVLIGCSTNEENTTDTSASETEETQSTETSNSESSSATSEETVSSESEATGESEEVTSSSSDQEKQKPVDISSELKMNPVNVLLPSEFPTDDPSSVSADITTNEEDHYTVNYTDDQGDLAEVSGTIYEPPEMADQEMTNFTDGIFIVEPNNETEEAKDELGTDLGHGITGYGIGSTGKSDFSWKEGNWQFSIHSRLEDQMNSSGIAQKIVDYLENNMLPAPKDQGMIYINYPQGGEEVDVDIRWQEEEMIYQLHTTRVPLEALEMTVSME